MEYLLLLRSAVYGDCRDFYLSLAPEQREEALKYIHEYALEPLFLPKLAEVLSEQERVSFQQKTQTLMIRSMMHEHGLKKMCQLLESQKIRHCRIKGTDLAYRIYPSPAMRPFGDWDILFHPDDFERAEKLLPEEGWKPLVPGIRRTTDYHLVPMLKDGFTIEPHFSLPNFKSADPQELWHEIHPVTPDSCHCILSPELNLLMLTRHATSNYYRHISLWKLLQDIAFLLKKEHVSWEKVHRLADQWDLPYPDDMIAAWSEFFPEQILKELTPDQEKCRLIRSLLTGTMDDADQWELVLQGSIWNFQWIRKRIKILHPDALRYKYHDQTSSYLSLAFRDLQVKISFFCKHIFHPSEKIKRHLDAIEKIEKKHK